MYEWKPGLTPFQRFSICARFVLRDSDPGKYVTRCSSILPQWMISYCGQVIGFVLELPEHTMNISYQCQGYLRYVLIYPKPSPYGPHACPYFLGQEDEKPEHIKALEFRVDRDMCISKCSSFDQLYSILVK